MARFPLGREAVALISLDGAAYKLADNIKDATLNLGGDEDDDTIRANGGWKATCMTLNEGSLDFGMKAKGDEPQFLALKNSYLPGGPVLRVKALSKPEADGGVGLHAWMTVTGMNRGESIGSIQEYSFSLKIANPPAGKETEIPAWIE